MSDKAGENAELLGAATRHRELLNWLIGVERAFEEYRDVVDADDEGVRRFHELANSVRDDGRELLEDGRLLRLGVVGQMKAGKSSLLNGLLFDGQEVLPKAATPMTASLTHIKRSDRDEVVVEYYSRSEWEDIREHADHYRKKYLDHRHGGGGVENGASTATADSPASPRESAPFLRASHELVEMAKDKRIDVDRHLDTTDRHSASVENLNRTLRDLVGAEGKLTPLVKSVKIECSQGIADIDIVDTPGINDPIVSRSLETDRLLSRCDALLLLSYAGQFMDSVDAALFQERVSAEGIGRRLLLASKFDSALIDVAKKYAGDIEEALGDVQRRLVQHCKNVLRQTAEEGEDVRIKEDNIVFVSPMCANLARKPVSNWLRDERDAFENLRHAYPAWFDHPDWDMGSVDKSTIDNLRWIGGQECVTERLRVIRREKDQIIKNRVDDFLREKKSSALRELADIVEEVRDCRDGLRDGDLARRRESIAKLRETIEDVRESVQNQWGILIDDQRNSFRKFSKNLLVEASKTRQQVSDAERTERRRESEGWWIPSLAQLIGKDTHKEYEEKVVDRVRLQMELENFLDTLRGDLDYTMRNAFTPRKAEEATKELQEIIADALPDEVAEPISTKTIRRLLRKTVRRIFTSAQENIQTKRGDIADFDTSVVESPGDAIGTIRILVDYVRNLVDRADKLIDAIIDQSTSVVAPISDQLEAETKRLEDEYAQPEFQLQRYALALDFLEGCIEKAPR